MKSKLTKKLSKEFERLDNEIKRSDIENEKYKKKISDNLKTINKNIIINSEQKMTNFTLWERIMRVLGMN
jgi:hypothetical protein